MKLGKKIKDERIIQLNNKIQSEAFILVAALLAISLFVKTYAFHLPFSECITELIVMVVSVVYISVRGSLVGYSPSGNSKNKKRNMIVVVIATSVLVTVINGIGNYSSYGDKYSGVLDGHFLAVLLITFISSSIFTSLVIGAVFSMEEYGQRRLEKKLEKEEE